MDSLMGIFLTPDPEIILDGADPDVEDVIVVVEDEDGVCGDETSGLVEELPSITLFLMIFSRDGLDAALMFEVDII